MDCTEALRPAAFRPLHPPGRRATAQPAQPGAEGCETHHSCESKLGSSALPGLRVRMKPSCRKAELLRGRLPWRPEACAWAGPPGLGPQQARAAPPSRTA